MDKIFRSKNYCLYLKFHLHTKMKLKSKKWKYTIIFTGEPVLPIYNNHNMVINSLTKENYDNYEESIKKNIDTHDIGYIILDDEKILLDKHKRYLTR